MSRSGQHEVTTRRSPSASTPWSCLEFCLSSQIHILILSTRTMVEELQRTNLELDSYKEKIKENQEKIKLNKQLPYSVDNIVEILEMNPKDEAKEDGANIDLDSQRKGKCVVLKTSTRQVM